MKNEKLRMARRQPDDRNEILERSISYSLRIIALYRFLNREHVGRVLGRQLLRAATSVGANAHEAQGAQSRADFIAKMSIAHKEARECSYWLRLITEAKLVRADRLGDLTTETTEIVKILAAILVSSKGLPRISEPSVSAYDIESESKPANVHDPAILHS